MDSRRAALIAGICFVVSLLLVNGYVQVRRSELTSEFGEEVEVITAKETIEEYELIRPEKLQITTVFKKFKQPQTTDSENEVVGKAAFVPIYAGEQITFTKLVNQDGKPVLERQLEKKMRAITLPIAPHTGVGKLIRPGNRVDVLAIVSYDQGGTTIYEIKTMVQNVLVLATGKTIQNSVPTRVNRDVLSNLEAEFEAKKRKDLFSPNSEGLATTRVDENYSNLTLQLSPEDAEKILYINHRYGDSRLYFTLRNSGDLELAKVDTTLLDDVLGPDSDYGRSKIKPAPITPPKYRFYDFNGEQKRGVY